MRKCYLLAITLSSLLVSCTFPPENRTAGRWRPFWSSRDAGAISVSNVPLNAALLERFKAEIRRFWQAPYVWGGASPQGTDCSGLVYIIYQRAAEVDIPRQTADLFDQGLPVPAELLRFTDLVFFNNGRGRLPTHVGLYIENGFFIHASVSSGVTLSCLSDPPFSENYIGARRFLP